MRNPKLHTSETYIKSTQHSPKKNSNERTLFPTQTGKTINQTLSTPCFRCGKFHWSSDCPFRTKKCLNFDKVGYKSSHCKSQNNKNRGRQAISNRKYENNIRKYVLIKILNKDVKFQLDSGLDLTIINLHTWRILNKPIIQKRSKTAKTVTGTKIKFEGKLITKDTFNGTTKKLKLFVLKNTENVFGTDWIQKFNLLDLPTNTLCQKVESLSTEKQSLKTELKKTFPEIFAVSLGKCTKQ